MREEARKRKERRVVEQGPDLFDNPDQLLKKPGPSATNKVLPRKDLVPAMVKRHRETIEQQNHGQVHQR